MMEETPKTNKNELPFSGKLIDSDVTEKNRGFGKLNEVENNPNKIIRIVRGYDEFVDNNKIIELIRADKKLFKELETEYDILVPADFLIGKDKKGDKIAYSIVDRIHGKNLEKVDRSNEVAVQVEALFASVAKYFLDKFVKNSLYLCDIGNLEQYVYGRKNGEQEDKIYLVDTDLAVSNNRIDMYLVMSWLVRNISKMERDFGTRFKEARKYVSQFVNQPLPEEADDSEKDDINQLINKIKIFLNDREFSFDPETVIPQKK